MRIGLAQIDCKLGAIEHNVSHMLNMVAQARERAVDLLVFPELSVTGYALGCIDHDTALSPEAPALQPLLKASGQMVIVFGFHEDGGLRSYNSAACFAAGQVMHVHRKLYLPNYSTFEERKHFSPGQTMRAFATDLGSMAMLICYDAWQSVLPFLAVQDGAKMLLIPTNSAESGALGGVDTADYWQNIARFHARIGECFVVFVNRVGRENDAHFFGRSHIVDPTGEILVEAPAHLEALIPLISILPECAPNAGACR
jgi:predicted amidohydrolase